MEIIEKEKIVEHQDGYGPNKRDINGKANAGVTLGIIGTALGAWSLFGNKRSSILGGGSNGVDPIVNINGLGGITSNPDGINCPGTFQTWRESCENDMEHMEKLYHYALNQQALRYEDREEVTENMHELYKETRNGFDALNAQHNRDTFNLYKSQRDSDDIIMKELSDLKAQVAINSAIRPYQDKLIQCEIDRAFNAGINYTDRKTCNVIYGQVCLPNEPTITGYVGANQCGCPRVIPAAATPAT